MDRTTKIILAAIAAGLWLNAAAEFVLPAVAQQEGISLRRIEQDLGGIARGTCVNDKIC